MKNQFSDNDIVFVTQPEPLTVLQYYDLAGISMWGWFGIELCFFVFFFVCAYLALKYVKHVKR